MGWPRPPPSHRRAAQGSGSGSRACGWPCSCRGSAPCVSWWEAAPARGRRRRESHAPWREAAPGRPRAARGPCAPWSAVRARSRPRTRHGGPHAATGPRSVARSARPLARSTGRKVGYAPPARTAFGRLATRRRWPALLRLIRLPCPEGAVNCANLRRHHLIVSYPQLGRYCERPCRLLPIGTIEPAVE